MSSNIEVKRICQHCGAEFIARTTVTKYCSHKCSQRAYKARKRNEKVNKSNNEAQRIKQQDMEQLKAKEFLTVREVAQLLSCSVRSVYYYIENGTIAAVNLGQRMTRVKRSEIDDLFQSELRQPEPVKYEIEDCYNFREVQQQYNVSEKALYEIIKRENVPKTKKGKYTYVPKTIIDKIFN